MSAPTPSLHPRRTHGLLRGICAAGIAATLLLAPVSAAAAGPVFNGGGISAGMNAASGIVGISQVNVRTAVTNVLITVLNLLATLAVAMVVAAGIVMILSFGEQERMDKAKKMIKYTLIGLVIVLFSRLLVSIVTNVLPSMF